MSSGITRADAPSPVLAWLPAGGQHALTDALRLEAHASGYALAVSRAPEGDTERARIDAAHAEGRRLDARYAVFASRNAVWVVAADGTVRRAPLTQGARGLSPRTFALVTIGLIAELDDLASHATTEPGPGAATDSDASAGETSNEGVDADAATPPADVTVDLPPGAVVRIEAPGGSTVVVVPAAPPTTPAPTVRRTLAFGLDFVPFAGTSSFTRGEAVRRFSLNVLGGLDHSLRGFEVGGLFNFERDSVRGFQVAGLSNAHRGALTGVQVAGIANVTGGDARGAQFSLVNVASRDLTGAQLGLVDVVAGDVFGAQVGLINVGAREVEGAQIGLVNVGVGRVRGAQIGLVNVSRDASFAFGLVNVVRDGRTQLDVFGTDSGFLYAALKHGGRHFHSILSVGIDPFLSHPIGAFGLGYGVRATPSRSVFVDLDLLAHVLVDSQTSQGASQIESTSTARLLLGIRVLPKLSLVVGASYEALFTRRAGRTNGFGVIDAHELGSPSGTDPTRVYGWPGLVFGVEVL